MNILKKILLLSLDLALIQVGILLSYLAKFGNELFLHRNAWEPYFDIWIIFNFLQLFLLYFYNLYTRSEHKGLFTAAANQEACGKVTEYQNACSVLFCLRVRREDLDWGNVMW